MPRPSFLFIGCWIGLIFCWPQLNLAAEGPTFNTVRIDGRNYINLADFARYYGFARNWEQQEKRVNLKSKYKSLRITLGSRECFIQGIRLWLNDAPLEHRNSILISEIDVQKTFHPLLRAWAIPRKKVRTIMIDPGHGGADQGTLGYRKSSEKRLALDLAKRVEKLLQKEGFNTLLTRRSDEFISLPDRSQLANSSETDLFVSLHFNSASPNSQPKGIETYCLTPIGLSSTASIRQRLGMGNFGKEPGNSFDSYNLLLAYLVQQNILKSLPGTEDRGVKRARFLVIKETECPSILVENGFLSNPAEEKRLLDPVYRNQLAAAIVKGIKSYSQLMNGK